MRLLVQFSWIDETLRLDVKHKRLELRPTIRGIEAVYFLEGKEQRREMLDLTGNAQQKAREWLESEPRFPTPIEPSPEDILAIEGE